MMPAVDQHSVGQEIAMRFVFIRHGHYDKPKDKAARPRASLIPQGREAAQRAGEFLREQSIIPDLLCHTSTARARETADIVLRELGVERPVVDVGSGFQKGATRREIEARVATWAALAVPAPEVIAFVGHDTQQIACLRELARGTLSIPKENRACVLVFDKDGDGWTLGAHHSGS